MLGEAARNGLQGDHHFFITFKTSAPGLRLSNRMRERYPDEMTIILQHQFRDLGVTDHAFEVGLSFSNVPERLLIPFAAITSFMDPSVQFGLKFDLQDGSQPSAETPDTDPNAIAPLPAPKALPAKRTLTAVASSSPGGPVPAEGSPVVAKAAERKTAKPALAKVADKSDDTDGKQDDGATKVVSIDAFRKKP